MAEDTSFTTDIVVETWKTLQEYIPEKDKVRAGCKVMKTRYSKPFEAVQVKIPYETGMNPYSGLLEMFEKNGVVVKDGNKLKYTTLAGEEIKEFRKQWTGERLQVVMDDIVSGVSKPQDDNISMVEETQEEENIASE